MRFIWLVTLLLVACHTDQPQTQENRTRLRSAAARAPEPSSRFVTWQTYSVSNGASIYQGTLPATNFQIYSSIDLVHWSLVHQFVVKQLPSSLSPYLCDQLHHRVNLTTREARLYISPRQGACHLQLETSNTTTALFFKVVPMHE